MAAVRVLGPQPEATGTTPIIVVGEFMQPGAYRGTYGFNGTSSSFRHTTLYQG